MAKSDKERKAAKATKIANVLFNPKSKAFRNLKDWHTLYPMKKVKK